MKCLSKTLRKSGAEFARFNDKDCPRMPSMTLSTLSDVSGPLYLQYRVCIHAMLVTALFQVSHIAKSPALQTAELSGITR